MSQEKPPPLPDPEVTPILTVENAGQYVGLGRTAAYQAAAKGELPVLRFGRRVVVSTAALRRLLQLDNDSTAA